jgi:hypothetical protein
MPLLISLLLRKPPGILSLWTTSGRVVEEVKVILEILDRRRGDTRQFLEGVWIQLNANELSTTLRAKERKVRTKSGGGFQNGNYRCTPGSFRKSGKYGLTGYGK